MNFEVTFAPYHGALWRDLIDKGWFTVEVDRLGEARLWREVS